jgi:hypothetical protein
MSCRLLYVVKRTGALTQQLLSVANESLQEERAAVVFAQTQLRPSADQLMKSHPDEQAKEET